MRNKTVIVTGGAGAIGGNLVNTLARMNNKVIVIDDLSSGSMVNFQKKNNIIFYKGSILDNNFLKKIFLRYCKKIDFVFHLAAHFANQNSVDHPEDDFLTNAYGTLKLLGFSKEFKVGKFVYASSSCVYGSANNDIKNVSVFNLDTPYAIAKLTGEAYVHFYHKFYKMKTVTLRYFNAFGPGDPPGMYRNVIPNFMYRALRNQPLVITGSGNETRDFTYIDDIVRGTILSVQTNKNMGEIFNIGTGREIKIRYIAQLINKISANKAGIVFIKRRKWDSITKRVADISAAKKAFGYYPKVTFEDGLKKAFTWFRTKYS